MADEQGPSTQVTVRIPAEWDASCTRLIHALNELLPGSDFTRAWVLRTAIFRGLASLDAEVEARLRAAKQPRPAKRARARTRRAR